MTKEQKSLKSWTPRNALEEVNPASLPLWMELKMPPSGTGQLTVESTLGRAVSHQEYDTPLYLSIDGGGTKTKVSIAGRKSSAQDDLECVILATGTSESSNHTSVGVKSAILSIRQATVRALRSLPNQPELNEAREWDFEGFESTTGCSKHRAPFSKVWAGLSGVDSQSDVELMTTNLKNLFGFLNIGSELDCFNARLKVTNDADLLSGAIRIHYRSNKLSNTKPCRGGVVLIAGTGSIAVGFGPQKQPSASHQNDPQDLLVPIARLGGYGYLVGDEGSAYYVGQQTIKEILKFNDVQDRLQEFEEKCPPSLRADPSSVYYRNLRYRKLIKKSKLIGLILNHFQIDSLNELLSAIYSIKVEQEKKIKIAEISRLVMKCGFSSKLSRSSEEQNEDDEFSIMILTRSAERLSELVCDLCHLNDLNPAEMVLCLGGGMWTYPQFKQLVIKTMHESWGASWGWIETIDQPDQVAALSLP